MTRTLESLTVREVLALAISVERANAERFRSFSQVFEGYEPGVAAKFRELAREEDDHERILMEKFEKRFGLPVPAVEEVEVKGVIEAVDLDDGEHLIFDSLDIDQVYRLALRAEKGAQDFYRSAQGKTADPVLALLFEQLADMEDDHAGWLESQVAARQE